MATLISTSLGEVRVDCADAGPWTFELESSGATNGVETVRVSMRSEREAVAPKFSVSWFVPQTGVHHVWTSESTHYGITWSAPMVSELTSYLPVYGFFSSGDTNRLTVACSESCRRVVFRAPISETRMGFDCSFSFFTVPEAPIREYAAEIRFDVRGVFYGRAIGEASRWIGRAAGIVPMRVPDSAFDGLYSTWYAFHQDVSADMVEDECRIASRLGLRTLIVDDGWQIDLPPGNHPWNGYRFCGDWTPGRRFPDMAAHVRRVQDMGFRYLLWYSVPFVGEQSASFSRFKDKLLPVCCAGGRVLDPRFPEVRDFIAGTYERAVREWNLDGLKLDFLGRFTLGEGVVDPAVAENYAGRDIKSIPLAVEALLTDVRERLGRLKPGFLIEFRQPYVGPSIRRFGNMLRAGDCPLSMVENRTRIARIRLTSGETAVHADMLEWRTDESPEDAALTILNAIFGVVQYSMCLSRLPKEHLRMLEHWIAFARAHQKALLRGEFRPRLPASDYPLLEGECAEERVIGVYQQGLAVSPGVADRPVIVLNATQADRLAMDIPDGFSAVEIFDTFGELRARRRISAPGLRSVDVPSAGYLKLTQVSSGPLLENEED